MLTSSIFVEKLADAGAHFLFARSHVNPYGYVPTFAVCVLFIALFALSGGMSQTISDHNTYRF